VPQNRVQYQEGFSLSDFIQAFGTEEKCHAALENARWPNGFCCPQCGEAESFGVIHDARRKRYQCKSCRHQTTVTAGTLFDSTKLPLTTWFQAIYLITHAKNGISAMELRRQLGVSYPTGWKIKHKLMQAMQEREGQYHLQGIIHVDDAYFGGEMNGGKAGRGSENKVPFVAAIELNDEGRPIRIKMDRVGGFTSDAIKAWARKRVEPGSVVFSDGLACFRATADAGCVHVPEIMGGRKPKDVPNFQWLNTIIGNVKTGLCGTYHAFNFKKYGDRYLAEITYRFNRRFNLKGLLQRLLNACIDCIPKPERLLRSEELCC
jgi:transposase-like protein